MGVPSEKNREATAGAEQGLVCRGLLSSVGDDALSMNEFARLADLYKNFSDPSRLRIIIELASGAMCVQCIADKLGMSQSAISHQLRVLRGARLVRYEKEGKNVVYALDDEHIEDILKIGVEHVRHSK
ncbi:MAG: metalloregulator ArsR/SmtB family transcription factor [Clostridiales Family XIII bacterium]|nr:metalloregulator ArsR/SmtB family transcription factor [Clostridiales Family XIII bacterium]